MKKSTKLSLVGLGAILGTFALTASACASDADRVGENLSTEAEAFNVQRTIIGVNAITDSNAFYVEGRCSIEREDKTLITICKHSDEDYRKHYLGLADNVYWVAVQTEGLDVSEYHTKIILKPQNIIPEFDIEIGEDGSIPQQPEIITPDVTPVPVPPAG